MDLLDVETELRSHLTGRAVPRAPEGLVARTRALHRRRRRNQAAAVGACLAVAVLFGSVPVLRAALPDVGRSDTAAPATALPSLYDLPPRGSLAEDTGWLADVAALPWDREALVDPHTLPPVGSHRVVYAADVEDTRVALVMGQDDGALSSAWFTGPAGADPDQLTQAAVSVLAYPDQPITLLDVADGAGLLLVVSRPGDEISYLQGTTVSADGAQAEDVVALEVQDGVGVGTMAPPEYLLGNREVRVRRDGQQVYAVPAAPSDRAQHLAAEPLTVSDPRGLGPAVDGSAVQTTVHWAVGTYGSGAEEVTPVLLAAGRLPGDEDAQVLMIGLTFPSGSTVVWASHSWEAADSSRMETTSLDPAPVGTPLVDQAVAVRVGGSLAVTAPAGAVSAVVLASDGTPVTTVPLVRGSGVTDLLPAPAPVAYRVQVLDAAGGVLAETQVQGTE